MAKGKSILTSKTSKRLTAVITALVLIIGNMPASRLRASDFVPSNNITAYGRRFIDLSEGQQWFINEIERILNRQQKTINRITNSSDLDFIFALGFAGKGLTGKIPAAVGELKRLKHIFLSGNILTGPIPDAVYTLKELETLDLAQNMITGTIKPDIQNLSNLRVLNLWGNELTGTIPNEIGSLSNIENIDLSYNKLFGIIPPSIGNLQKLKLFSASNNALTGTIPASISGCISLKSLLLWNNRLAGEIPGAFGSMLQLELLDLAQNGFTGALPPELPHSLREISVRNNQLTGEIPEQYGELAKLEVFDLYQNSFSGPIPQGFADMPELRKFDISDNRITGTLPDFQSTGKLEIAWVNNNRLAGYVPQTFLDCQNNILLNNGRGGDVDVSRNYLTGSVLRAVRKNGDNFGDGADTLQNLQNRMYINSWVQIRRNQETNIYRLFVTRSASDMSRVTLLMVEIDGSRMSVKNEEKENK